MHNQTLRLKYVMLDATRHAAGEYISATVMKEHDELLT